MYIVSYTMYDVRFLPQAAQAKYDVIINTFIPFAVCRLGLPQKYAIIRVRVFVLFST